MDQDIRILTDFTEKQKTRPLYEQAFDDPAAFVDYYYREKCTDNRMIVLEEEGTVLSMVHLNPYTVSICGKEVLSYYLVAVATDRHQQKSIRAVRRENRVPCSRSGDCRHCEARRHHALDGGDARFRKGIGGIHHRYRKRADSAL